MNNLDAVRQPREGYSETIIRLERIEAKGRD